MLLISLYYVISREATTHCSRVIVLASMMKTKTIDERQDKDKITALSSMW